MSKPLDGLPLGAEREQAEATQLYRLAAEQGVAGAQCRLGVMYAEGRGVAQDNTESVRWFRLAAEQGDAEAQAALGLAYAAGRGVAQDLVASYSWLTIAAARLTGATRSGALKFRGSLVGAMSAEQITSAQRLAQEHSEGAAGQT